MPSSRSGVEPDFPSFSEGLSLRDGLLILVFALIGVFPFLFGGTFIEGAVARR